MPSLDANCLVRLVVADVPDQATRVEALLDSGERYWVDDLALIESVFVWESLYKLERETIAQAVGRILGVAAIDTDRALWTEAVHHYRLRPKLSIMDILLALRARRRDALPLLTFDHKLAHQMSEAELLLAD
jgi:predicted nucleic-acid-binding protein